MVRTQIQLPDELYRRVKRVAAAQGWTFAETMRRAAERLLESLDSQWPAPMALGKFLHDAEDWRELANQKL
jgi:predicted DNA-binding protein